MSNFDDHAEITLVQGADNLFTLILCLILGIIILFFSLYPLRNYLESRKEPNDESHNLLVFISSLILSSIFLVSSFFSYLSITESRELVENNPDTYHSNANDIETLKIKKDIAFNWVKDNIFISEEVYDPSIHFENNDTNDGDVLRRKDKFVIKGRTEKNPANTVLCEGAISNVLVRDDKETMFVKSTKYSAQINCNITSD